jgi:NADP-dependent 3-hydroxy acid dehydrogenase YdfG
MADQRSDLDIHPRKALVTGATAGIGRLRCDWQEMASS